MDSGPPVTDIWLYDQKAAAKFRNTGALIEGLSRSKTLRVRAYDYLDRRVDMTFDLTGADLAIQELASACADL
jgi:hypothetical protein